MQFVKAKLLIQEGDPAGVRAFILYTGWAEGTLANTTLNSFVEQPTQCECS